MARHGHMPRISDEQLGYPASKPVFSGLFKELAGDGARWADAELALTRAEAGALLQRYMTALAVVSMAIAAIIAAVVILAQACVIALLPYVNEQVSANLIVGFTLIGLVMVLALIARLLLSNKTRPMSLIFRWLAGADAPGRTAK